MQSEPTSNYKDTIKLNDIKMQMYKDNSNKNTQKCAQSTKLIIGFSGGFLTSFWSPLSAASQGTDVGQLTTYSAIVCVALGIFATALPLWFFLVKLEDQPTNRQRFDLNIFNGALGALVWSAGFVCNLVGGYKLGFSLSYAIGSCAPLVAIMWGLF